MFAICVESSHARGMGHLFRSLNLAAELGRRGHATQFMVNDHAPSIQILQAHGHIATVVDLSSAAGGWETAIAARFGADVWINDRLDTDAEHVNRLTRAGLRVVTFDDTGKGASLSDLNVAALAFDPSGSRPLGGARVLKGPDYLVLNPSIARFQRERKALGSILVTLGGSDTYGVTPQVVRLLGGSAMPVTVVLGPGFQHEAQLSEVLGPRFVVKRGVPSMIEEMASHDLAITGGGITPFEANAAGLPCIVVANEVFEVPVGEALQEMGGCVFAGHHTAINTAVFSRDLPLGVMSRAGMSRIGLGGTARVADAIEALKAS